MKLTSLALVFSLALLIPDMSHAQSLVTNGDFETGDFTGWTLGGNTGSVFVSTENPNSGLYSAHLGPNGSDGTLSQNVITQQNRTYQLTYHLDVNDSGTPNNFSTSIGGVTVFSQTNMAAQPFTTYNYQFTATGATSLLQFAYRHDPDHFFLDDISIFPLFGQTPGLTPNQQVIANAIDQFSPILTTGPAAVLVSVLDNVPIADNGAVLDQLSPEKFGSFTSVLAFNNASFETEAMDNYLAGQRAPNGSFLAGHGNIDASGLTINDPSYDPSLSMVHSRLLAWNAAPLSSGLVTDMPGSVLGGMEMKDGKDMKSMQESAYTNPWNFFVRGNVILAQGFSQQDVPHFDENTESVVLGTDYRITPNFLVGLTAGYAHTDVTLDNDGSSATVDSYSPGIYASYANKGWYANLTGSYLHNAYTQSRVVGFIGQTANSAPEGDEGVANLDGGYDFHHGALTFGPLVGLQYTHLTVNGYNESGSIADLSVNEQQSDSLRSRLGGRVSYRFNDSGIAITPHFDVAWQHEFMDQSRGITSQFSFGGGSFAVSTPNPSRESALANVGVDADICRTVTVFTDYTAQAGQDNYFGQSVQAGVKIGF